MARAKTGYPRGRQRNGETRPTIPKNVRRCARRAERIAAEPNYAGKLAENMRTWRANNPERAKEISRNAYLRKKNWDTCGNKFGVAGDFTVKRKAKKA